MLPDTAPNFFTNKSPVIKSLKDLPKYQGFFIPAEKREELTARFQNQLGGRLHLLDENESYSTTLPGIKYKILSNIPADNKDPKEPKISLVYKDNQGEEKYFSVYLTKDAQIKAEGKIPEELQHLALWQILEDMVVTSEIYNLSVWRRIHLPIFPEGEGDPRDGGTKELPGLPDKLEERRLAILTHEPNLVVALEPTIPSDRSIGGEYTAFVFHGCVKGDCIIFENPIFDNALYYIPCSQNFPDTFKDKSTIARLSDQEIVAALDTALTGTPWRTFANLVLRSKEDLYKADKKDARRLYHDDPNMTDEQYEAWFRRRIRSFTK